MLIDLKKMKKGFMKNKLLLKSQQWFKSEKLWGNQRDWIEL